MKKIYTHHGFTLIEVVIALTILSWVLGSVLFLVSQYADERLLMRERFYGNQVAWNQLLNNYQKSMSWVSLTQSTKVELNGREQQGGQDWDWQLDVAPAMGRDLFRYHTSVSSAAESDIESSLTMYLLSAQSGQGRTAAEGSTNP